MFDVSDGSGCQSLPRCRTEAIYNGFCGIRKHVRQPANPSTFSELVFGRGLARRCRSVRGYASSGCPANRETARAYQGRRGAENVTMRRTRQWGGCCRISANRSSTMSDPVESYAIHAPCGIRAGRWRVKRRVSYSSRLRRIRNVSEMKCGLITRDTRVILYVVSRWDIWCFFVSKTGYEWLYADRSLRNVSVISVYLARRQGMFLFPDRVVVVPRNVNSTTSCITD